MSPILIVDDAADYRAYLADLLARDGVPLLTLSSGRAALALIKEQAVAALVTDIMMPDMDGIELVRAVRRTRRNLPILVLSAYEPNVAEVYLKAAIAVGATFVGRKGDDDVTLLRALTGVVDFHQHTQRRTHGV
jgi:CheY-like chemotaxis protein